MDLTFIYSTAILLLMLMDPFGNLPMFIATLRNVPQERFPRVILRESCFAFLAMVFALALGRSFMGIMHIAPGTLGIAGGLILLLMGIKMVFPAPQSAEKIQDIPEPFIVPLAIPLICGPGLFAILVTIRTSDSSASFTNCLAALFLAWLAQTLILLCGRRIARLLGPRMLDALESLMGLLLTCIAVGLLINGINETYGLRTR